MHKPEQSASGITARCISLRPQLCRLSLAVVLELRAVCHRLQSEWGNMLSEYSNTPLKLFFIEESSGIISKP